MATRTVSAAGGNFNATGTWVGGVAPVAGDDIIANATSGNLNISSSTVSLLTANFTGYTGTLSFGSNTINFNQASGSTALTIGSGMTITFSGNGCFDFQRNATITSPVAGKAIPLRVRAGLTITLVNDLTLISNVSTTALSTTFTGANVILTMTSLSVSYASTTISSPYKMYWRPSGSATISSFTPPRGYFSVDTTNVITINSPFSLSNGSLSNTFEFEKAAGWTGSLYTNDNGAIRTCIAPQSSGLSCNVVMTAPTIIDELQIGSGIYTSNPVTTINFSKGAVINNLTLSVQNGIYRSLTASIYGNGFLTASNVYIETPRTNTLTGTADFSPTTITDGRMGVALSPTFSYSFGTVSISGKWYNKSKLESIQNSVSATVSIINAFITNANITDIANVGTVQLAYSSMGNTLTRSSGFTTTEPSGGGGGGSFTFVN
jgi:hypothetical protein